jgi:hypothetical protein
VGGLGCSSIGNGNCVCDEGSLGCVALMVKVLSSFEMLVTIHMSKWHNIPGEMNLQKYCCENSNFTYGSYVHSKTFRCSLNIDDFQFITHRCVVVLVTPVW